MSAPAQAAKKRPRQKRRAFRHGIGQVYSERRGKWVWAYDLRINRSRVQESGFPSRERAEAAVSRLKLRALDEKYGLPSDEPSRSVSLAQLVEARLADPQRKAMPSYDDSARILRLFRDHFAPDAPVTAITTADVRAWINASRPSIGPGTLNTELSYVSSLLRAAGSYFPELESFQPPPMPYARKPEERDRPLTFDEARRIVSWLLAPDAPARERRARLLTADIFRLGLMTGMRLGEWRLRRWSQVDFDTALIRLTKTKTGRPRTIKMTPSVRAILARRYAERGGSDYVFAGIGRSARPVCEGTVRRQLVLAAEALKIPYGRATEGGFTFHDTRHTAVTAMLARGADLATVAELAGHSKGHMTMRYAHASAESRERALRSLEIFSFGEEVEEKQQTNSDNSS